MFFEQFENLCRENGTTPTKFTTDVLKLSSSKVTAWKKGSIPKYEILQLIADKFNVTVGFLFDGGFTNSDFNLSDNELTIIELFRKLSETQQGELIGRAKMMTEQNNDIYKQKGAS